MRVQAYGLGNMGRQMQRNRMYLHTFSWFARVIEYHSIFAIFYIYIDLMILSAQDLELSGKLWLVTAD